MSMMIQFVFKALPGSDMPTITENVKTATKLWKKHGAGEVSFWMVTLGEVGNMAVTVAFDNYAAYGNCYDSLIEDTEFRKWQADSVKAGMTEWVRSNIARKIPLG
jgi:hypothetical protein